MEIKLRAEKTADHSNISDTIIAAYRNVDYSNHREQLMVERLRNSNSFIPQLSIVAEDENSCIAGHILLTKIHIINPNTSCEALTLAPLSIRPEYQNRGIGKQLVIESHRIAKNLGFKYIAVLGHANYYPKFGYLLTSKYQIKIPIKIKEENSMIISLTETGFSEITGGTIQYSKEFFEQDR